MYKKRVQIQKIVFFCMLFLIFLLNRTTLHAEKAEKLVLSKEEQSYIKKKKILKIAIVNDWLPFSAQNQASGSYQGLLVEMLREFATETGLELMYVKTNHYLDAIEAVEDNTADIATMAINYEYSENTYQMNITDPYLILQMMIIYDKNTNLSEISEYRMAEVGGYPQFSDNPIISHMFFSTPEECLAAIRAGHADLMYCDIFTGMQYIQQYQNRDLISLPIHTNMQFSIGISLDEEPILRDLLNRFIQTRTRGEVVKSLIDNRLDFSNSFGNFIYRYPFEVICVFLVLAFVIVLIVITYIRVKNRYNLEMQGYEESYCLLADTFGEAGLDYNYMEDTMTVFGKYADKLALKSKIENFSYYLGEKEREISFVKHDFKQMLIDGALGTSYDADLECKLSNGEWQHFRLIFSVITTNESYRRPIRMIGCLTNVEENYQEKERLLYFGMYDKVTGLFNRVGAETKIKERFESGKSIEKDLVLIIDVDYFKQFNDTHGHDCGDDVLRNIGECLRKIFRKEDILCRWGGDEYVLYLFDIGVDDYIEFVKKRCCDLQKMMKQYQYEEHAIAVTLSIGGAVVGNKSFEDAFKVADRALYIVKEEGRDSICILSE